MGKLKKIERRRRIWTPLVSEKGPAKKNTRGPVEKTKSASPNSNSAIFPRRGEGWKINGPGARLRKGAYEMRKRSEKERELKRAAFFGAICASLAAGGLIWAPLAAAALGGPPTLANSAPQAVAQVMARAQSVSGNATTNVAANAAGANAAPEAGAGGWSAREQTAADGGVVREYVGADGLVFAVAWRGPRRPDLSALLGPDYATKMSSQAQTLRQAGQGSREQTNQAGLDFGVSAVAHQRFSAGVAWLPQKLPTGLNANALAIAKPS